MPHHSIDLDAGSLRRRSSPVRYRHPEGYRFVSRRPTPGLPAVVRSPFVPPATPRSAASLPPIIARRSPGAIVPPWALRSSDSAPQAARSRSGGEPIASIARAVPCGTSTSIVASKPLIFRRFLDNFSSSCRNDAVMDGESRQAGSPLARLWITWISGIVMRANRTPHACRPDSQTNGDSPPPITLFALLSEVHATSYKVMALRKRSNQG